MRRLLGLAYLAVLVAVMLLTWSTPQALANHVQCGDVITQDTKLDSDLVDCPRYGIVIGADGITLDLNGHTIDGDSPSNLEPCDVGILNGPELTLHCPRATLPGRHDVTVRNGAIRQFDAGVIVREASRNRLRGLTISDSYYAAAIVAESDQTSIERNLLRDNWSFAGVLNLGDASRIRIAGNVVSGNAHNGTESDGINDSVIERNLFVGNHAGMHLHGTRNNLIRQNWATGNSTGIELSDGVSDNRVFDNWVVGNSNIGIMTQEGVHRNRIERNFVVDNGSVASVDSAGILVLGNGGNEQIEGNILLRNYQGIVLENSSENLVARNWVFRSTADGIVLRNPVPFPIGIHRVERNIVTRNGDDGIDLDASGVYLSRNSASRNGDLGIEAVPGVTDGGGNRAFGNGNPLQCLNVECR